MLDLPDRLLDILVRESRQYRRSFFRHHGLGPWPCFDCGEEVVIEEVQVHHVNQNHVDESPENLVAAHRECHSRYHGKSNDMDSLREIRWADPEAGRRHSEAMAAVSSDRVLCECGRSITRAHLNRHKASNSCRKPNEELP